MRTLLDRYRHSLTNYDSALAYALLGIVGGVASGLLVLAFELAIGQLGGLWGIAGGDDFESLPRWLQFGLPVAGAIILGLAFSLLQPEDRETGIVHVLSRMHSHYGALPLPAGAGSARRRSLVLPQAAPARAAAARDCAVPQSSGAAPSAAAADSPPEAC